MYAAWLAYHRQLQDEQHRPQHGCQSPIHRLSRVQNQYLHCGYQNQWVLRIQWSVECSVEHIVNGLGPIWLAERHFIETS